MSDTPPPPPQLPPSARRHGCLTALMVVAGLLMLLPGLCAMFFGVELFVGSNVNATLVMLVLLGLFVGFLGIMLIRAAASGPRP